MLRKKSVPAGQLTGCGMTPSRHAYWGLKDVELPPSSVELSQISLPGEAKERAG
ncbi:hypothetical protein [Nocardia sp. CDC160]|uniref:hypothetical protein n=1 Tax=Nocardia sp. CDC160 TaxID=3112166 RepID=UPI002DBAF2EC|nr:hypothetical protein [Nocardia sp. CDC160]MEC3920310.1 hypothetical protein [Nocardia sp. CDC160]